MTQESIQPIIDWISQHPNWSGFIVFLISLSESLAIVGLVVPGIVLMTAIGAMMGAGILPFWLTLTWAILGAIVGDGISYWLGYHFHEHLRDFWPFKQFPKLLDRGETFFRQHGGKSIVFGRFVGPVRPMIPVIAGMMDMSPKRFLFFNILSAIAWAPLYSLPGILIGASLGNLPPEVASRIGFLVLLLLFILWLFYEFLILIGFWIASAIRRLLNRLWRTFQSSKRFSFLHKALQASQGTEEGQLGILLLFIFATVSFIIIFDDVLKYEGITQWNESIYQALRALYTDKLIAFSYFITNLGEAWVLIPTVCVVGLWLLWRQRYKTAFCWLGTIGLGFLTGHIIKVKAAILRPEGLAYFTDEYSFPSGHAITAMLTYGLAAVLIHHTVAPKHRWIPWAIAIPLIFVISLSRLYLGVHWFTDILGGLTLGLAFVTAGAFIYRRIEARPIPMRAILMPGLLMLAIMLTLYTMNFYPTQRKELVRQWPKHVLVQKVWWAGKENINSLYRTGAVKRHATLFDVQWLGSLQSIEQILHGAGFIKVPKLSVTTAAQILANHPAGETFPVMPKFHRDRLPVLTVVKIIDKTKRLVLQLWSSDYETPQKVPLWVGTLRIEEESHPLPLVSIYLESTHYKSSLSYLTQLPIFKQIPHRVISITGSHQTVLIISE